MQESYIIWNDKSSKDFGLMCESVNISQPEQKIKILSTSNTDNNYNYSSKNTANRPYFENRIITVTSYFKFESISEKAEKISKIMSWLYTYNKENIVKILPDYSNVKWINATLENVQTIEVVAAHTVRVIFQFRVDAFSIDEIEQVAETDILEFNKGKYSVKYNNIGFYTKNLKIKLTGACNWTTITNLENNNSINIKNGFSNSCVIDFKNKKIICDDIDMSYDVNFFEVAPGLNDLVFESDGSYKAEFRIYNNYLYSYTAGEANGVSASLIEG